MTQELKEQLKVVAIYDGWIAPKEKNINDEKMFIPKGFTVFEGLKKGSKLRFMSSFTYHTNIADLWPVAKNVLNELDALFVADSKSETGREAFRAGSRISQKAFDISGLFVNVYNAILFLNKLTS